jgi:hypothetical protein
MRTGVCDFYSREWAHFQKKKNEYRYTAWAEGTVITERLLPQMLDAPVATSLGIKTRNSRLPRIVEERHGEI